MKTIIAGTRTCTDERIVLEAILLFLGTRDITEVVSGCAAGPDDIGERWARRSNIPIKRFNPDLSKLGRAAGPIRNRDMAEYADALIAVWDGKSPGTANMIEEAKARNLVVYVYRIPDNNSRPLEGGNGKSEGTNQLGLFGDS